MTTITELLNKLDNTRNLRRIPPEVAGPYFDLSGNDYLGLAADSAEFEEEFLDLHAGKPLLFTSAASRLLSTRQTSHLALEEEIEQAYGRPALLFNSGYHANVGTIGSLAQLPGTVFMADKLVHASIIDGLRQSGAIFYRYIHNDTGSLRKLIERHAGDAERIIIITESVFSMDGDRAPLAELTAIKRENPKIMLYIDEAHAFGVFGPRGLGLTAEIDATSGIFDRNITNDPDSRESPFDIVIGTFGKAGASYGAFVVCREDLKQWLVNTSRSFIFSTALPPVTIEWSRFILDKILKADDRRKRLVRISESFRGMITRFTESLCKTGGVSHVSTTQIVPFLTGSAESALEFSSELRESGVLALAIRRPTVPPGTERIRFSLHARLPDNIADITEKIISVRLGG